MIFPSWKELELSAQKVFPGVTTLKQRTEKHRLVVGRIVKGQIIEYKTAANQASRDPADAKPAAGQRCFADNNSDEEWIADWRGNRAGMKKPWWKFW